KIHTTTQQAALILLAMDLCK
ncbi:hypothetical protein A2U01_0118065, partial [Trifolium medium]|nr:hypothetical protein [Trifolium medium]